MKLWIRFVLTFAWFVWFQGWMEMHLTHLYPHEKYVWATNLVTQFIRLLNSHDLLSWIVVIGSVAGLAFVWVWHWRRIEAEITAIFEHSSY